MIDTRVLIGLISILIAMSSVVWVGINEAERQETFKEAFVGRNITNGAILFEEFCSPCHGIKGVGISGVAPSLNSTEFFYNRLDELGYQGSLEAYLTLTVAGGRPVQSNDGPWPQNMPTWSVDYGGPLRNDQVDSVVAYIMHFGEFVPEPGAATPTPTPLDCETDEECGELLFQNLGCIGCHIVSGEGGAVGPDLTNLVTDQDEDYVRQSITNPNAVIADGFVADIMPKNFGERLSDAEMDMLISYLTAASSQ